MDRITDALPVGGNITIALTEIGFKMALIPASRHRDLKGTTDKFHTFAWLVDT